MDKDDQGRTNIEDLPRAEEEVTKDEAKEVQGGLRDLLLDLRATNNTTIGGALSSDPSNPTRK